MKMIGFILLATVFSACSHQMVTEAPRGVASVVTRRPLPVSCQHAYDAAKSSNSAEELAEAALACEKAAEATCIVIAQRSGDASDTRICAMSAAYGANKAANNGNATADCEKAFSEAKASPARGPMEDAIVICDRARQTLCDMSVGEKAGAFYASSCALRAAYGSFQQVQTKSRTRKM